MFHGFGMTKQPVCCSARNVRRFSAIVIGRSRRQRGGDNASNPHAIAINLAFVSDSGGLRCATAAINTRAASIFTTPSCDRNDVSFTFRGGGTRKHKKATAYSEATYRTQDRGTDLVRPGPLYFSGVY